jgi:hypothetical protein
MWSALTRRPRRLLSLAEVEERCQVHNCCQAGLRTVPIDQIRGSAGRASDFDRDFCPLQDRTRQRWLGVARARQEGKVLPPVDLARVGEVYFCLDGHHRLSVARALGQRYIEARVTVWQVSGPLPWEAPAAARSPLAQGSWSGQFNGKVREGILGLEERVTLNLQSPLSSLGTA